MHLAFRDGTPQTKLAGLGFLAAILAQMRLYNGPEVDDPFFSMLWEANEVTKHVIKSIRSSSSLIVSQICEIR